MPLFARPPLDFGPPWTPVGEHRRRGETRALWHLDGPTAAFSDAYRAVRSDLVAAGFSWTEHGTARGTLVPCWWGGVDEADADVPALQAAVDWAIAAAAGVRAEAAAKAEARRLEGLARVAEQAAPIRARLLEIVSTAQWQLGRQLSEAADLAHQAEWGIYDMERAERWVSNADGNRTRAEERIASRRPIQWFERAADPDVRAAAHEGLRILAGRDEDWASIDNGIGFSQVTCWAGHALAERETLDQGEAAHGLSLLYQHRSQLPPDVVLRALGIEPKPTRWRLAGLGLIIPHRNGDPRPMTFFARLIALILGILTMPLRWLGLGPSPDSAQARAAMALADAAPAPANDDASERAPSPFAGADLGYLIKDHAAVRLRQRHPAMPELAPLPFWAQFWFDNLDDVQLKKIVSPSIPGWLLQRHVLAGTAGTLPSLGYVTPAPKDSATGSASGGRDGKSAGGGVKPAKVNLQEVLEELGYAPSRGMRPH